MSDSVRSTEPAETRPLELSAEDEGLLAAARNPDGSTRFYRLGQHPATYRLRKHREALASLPGDWPNIQEGIDYIDRKLAEFDMAEGHAMREYLRVMPRG